MASDESGSRSGTTNKEPEPDPKKDAKAWIEWRRKQIAIEKSLPEDSSKEAARLARTRVHRERFYKCCLGLAFGRLHPTELQNWFRAICEVEESLRVAVLLEFLRTVAEEMPWAEDRLKRGRGCPPKIEESALIEADSDALGLSLPEAIMKTGAAQNIKTARKKATAIRSRRYRAKKRSVTQKP